MGRRVRTEIEYFDVVRDRWTGPLSPWVACGGRGEPLVLDAVCLDGYSARPCVPSHELSYVSRGGAWHRSGGVPAPPQRFLYVMPQTYRLVEVHGNGNAAAGGKPSTARRVSELTSPATIEVAPPPSFHSAGVYVRGGEHLVDRDGEPMNLDPARWAGHSAEIVRSIEARNGRRTITMVVESDGERWRWEGSPGVLRPNASWLMVTLRPNAQREAA